MIRGARSRGPGFDRTSLVMPRASGIPHASKILMTNGVRGNMTSGYRLLTVVDHPQAPDSCRP